jgi:hypothetical protein
MWAIPSHPECGTSMGMELANPVQYWDAVAKELLGNMIKLHQSEEKYILCINPYYNLQFNNLSQLTWVLILYNLNPQNCFPGNSWNSSRPTNSFP